MRRILLLLILIISVPLVGQMMTGSPPFQPPIITPDNLSDLQMVEHLGQGSANETLAFSPVDERIAVGSRRGIYLYENLDAEPQLIELYREDGTPFNVTSLLFAPDGNWIFVGSDEETITGSNEERVLTDHEEIIAYDLVERRLVYRLTGNTPHAVSNDASMLAYETETGINISDISSGELLYNLSYEAEWVSKTEISLHVRTVRNVHFNAADNQVFVGWYQTYGTTFAEIDEEIDLWHLVDEPSHISIADARDFVTRTWDVNFRSAPNGLEYAIENGVLTTPDAQFTLLPEEISVANYSVTTTLDMMTLALPYWNEGDDSGTYYAKIGIWDAESGLSVADITVSARSYQALQLNADASLLAVGLDVYDVANDELLRRLRIDEYSVISGSEHIAHYDENNNIHILDNAFNTLTTLPMTRDQFSYFGRVFDSMLPVYSREADERVIYNISLETGILLGEIRYPQNDGYPRFSANQSYLVSTSTRLGTRQQIWDFTTATLIELPDNTQPISPYFTSDERVILWNEADSELWIYDFLSTDTIKIPVPQSDEDELHIPYVIVLSEDDTVLLFQVSTENRRSLFNVWNLSDTEQASLQYEGQANGHESDLSEDGRYVAINAPGEGIQVIDTVTDTIIFKNPSEYVGTVSSIFLNGSHIYFSFGELGDFISYDWQTGELYEPVPVQRPILTTDTMLFYKDDNRVLRITAADGLGLREIDLGRNFSSLTLSEDARRLWIDFTDGTVELWMIQP